MTKGLDRLVLAAIEQPKLCGQKNADFSAARAFVKELFDITDGLEVSRIIELCKRRVVRERTARCLAAHVAAVCSSAYCVFWRKRESLREVYHHDTQHRCPTPAIATHLPPSQS